MNGQNLIRDFIRPNPEIPIAEYRYYIIGKITHIFGLTIHSIWLPIFYMLDAHILTIYNVFSIIIFSLNLSLNRKGHYLTAISFAGVEVNIHQTIAVLYLGWSAGFQYYLLCALMLPFLVEKPQAVMKYLLTIICVSTYLYLEIFYRSFSPIYQINEYVIYAFKYSNILFSMALIILWSLYFNSSVNHAEDALTSERSRSEKLLNSILPHSVVYQLEQKKEKHDNTVLADDFEHVSVLFLDIVNFTSLASRLSPDKLVGLLNRLFSMLDANTEKHGLEKIKTIGDAYMVASGVPNPQKNTAERLFHFALNTLNQLPEFNKQNNSNISIRIGINSGPVVAGVIGVNKYTFDLWGETVNIAARLESTADPNAIHISESTYHVLKNKYNFIKRSPIELKGMGIVQTYQYRKPESVNAASALNATRQSSRIPSKMLPSQNWEI